MSGGVDSSVAAYLLKQQGYEVIGIMMKLSPDNPDYEENEGGCCSISAASDARRVADVLDIPFYVMNFKDAFKKNVIDNFIDEYMEGRTPNPCIVCNKIIKFEEFLRKAKALGADYIATGHYAKIEKQEDRYVLKKADDDKKDQTYALYNLTQEQLRKTLMPCGDYRKTRIREIAKEMDLGVHNKKDSQEICFIDDNNHGRYIYEKKPELRIKGNFVDPQGKVLGEHKGIAYYTIGQRKGLNVGGTKEALFIIATDVKSNSIFTGQGVNHPGLFKKALRVQSSEIHWVREDLALKNGETMQVMARIRYRQPLEKATLFQFESGLYVSFENPQSAITEGQFVAWNIDDELVGSGVIS